MPSARRTGRNARRIDVMAKSHAGPGAPSVIFEAKLVVSNRDVGAYLGRDGLGCFTLPPDAYEADRVAAMIAYVVDGTSEHWWTRIEGEMARRRPAPLSQHRVRHSDVDDPLLWSRVERPALAGALPLNVAHLVLRFEAVRRVPQ